MAGSLPDKDRQVVPRWRSLQTTTSLGELAPLAVRPEIVLPDDSLADLRRQWEEDGGLAVAADFVSVAYALGQKDEAQDAARYLADRSDLPLPIRNVVRLHQDSRVEAEPVRELVVSPPSLTSLQRELHETRVQLRAYPRDATMWVNLARLCVSLGSFTKANDAISVALQLAPDHPFVLRSAARFFLHAGEGVRAHRLLSGSDLAEVDPWVMSAEIAIADAIGRTSRRVRAGRHMLDRGEFSDLHASELASAIGTLDSKAGAARRGLRLIRQSLRSPSENAVAQAAWLRRNVVGEAALAPSLESASFEAEAWLARSRGDWQSAVAAAAAWQSDQMFSSRPAVMGSFVASRALERYEDAVQFAKLGLISNPDDCTLLNNLAFAYANLNRTDEARAALADVALEALSPLDAAVCTATSGLIAYRSGDVAEGRRLYESAAQEFRRRRDFREVVALVYQAIEEVRHGTPEAEQRRRDALVAADKITDAEILALVERLKASRAPSPS